MSDLGQQFWGSQYNKLKIYIYLIIVTNTLTVLLKNN